MAEIPKMDSWRLTRDGRYLIKNLILHEALAARQDNDTTVTIEINASDEPQNAKIGIDFGNNQLDFVTVWFAEPVSLLDLPRATLDSGDFALLAVREKSATTAVELLFAAIASEHSSVIVDLKRASAPTEENMLVISLEVGHFRGSATCAFSVLAQFLTLDGVVTASREPTEDENSPLPIASAETASPT